VIFKASMMGVGRRGWLEHTEVAVHSMEEEGGGEQVACSRSSLVMAGDAKEDISKKCQQGSHI
jgi:hypothetical protein